MAINQAATAAASSRQRRIRPVQCYLAQMSTVRRLKWTHLHETLLREPMIFHERRSSKPSALPSAGHRHRCSLSLGLVGMA